MSVIPAAQPTDAGERRKLIYVFDKTSGAPVHTIELDAFSAAAPMTDLHGGKQYIVVAVSGGNYSGEYIAFRLPQ